MDFVFGTYVNDHMKLANHRALRDGVQHRFDLRPLNPRPGQAITVGLVCSAASGVTQAALYFTTDNSTPDGSRGVARNGVALAFERIRTEWDSLSWQYLTHWQAVIPPQPENTMVQYRISAWADDGDEIYADWPEPEARVLHEAMVFWENVPKDTAFQPDDRSAGSVFNVLVDDDAPPAWAVDAVIYHIFLDRYYPGDGKDWLQTDDIEASFGGTLWGVRDKLDDVADLGAECIWLSPLHPSPSYHRYDATDYRAVADELGGADALRAVVEGAHQRGMRVILDVACNHLSDQHPYFVEAKADPNSAYRDWFYFDDTPLGYRAFFNVPEMPEINLAHPAARDWMVENAVYWLREFNVDGFRLDFANGPGPSFWSYFRQGVKAASPDCLIFGEIIEAPDKLRQYAGRLDGSLDFPANDALRRRFGWQNWTQHEYDHFIASHADYFSPGFLLPTFIDNHDMDRLQFIAKEDKAQVRAALTAQFALPKPAIIYYGVEVGLRQKESAREVGLSASRVPMVFDDAERDLALRQHVKALIAQRKASRGAQV